MRQRIDESEKSETECMRAEEASRVSEEWLFTILKGIGDALVATDTKGKV